MNELSIVVTSVLKEMDVAFACEKVDKLCDYLIFKKDLFVNYDAGLVTESEFYDVISGYIYMAFFYDLLGEDSDGSYGQEIRRLLALKLKV